MDQETANALFNVGGFLLFFNAPPNLEFGIDYNAWTVGPLFKGVKLIPPGLHFIYFSATSKEGVQGIRTGFFKYFESQEVVVREWNPASEDLRDETELDPDQVERYRLNIRDFDRNMGPYPLDPPTFYQRWQRLTNYITPGLVRRILPNNGRVSHLPSKSASTDEVLDVKDKRVGRQVEKEEGMEFTYFDLRQSFPRGATGDEVTRWSLDKSWLARDLLQRVYRNNHTLMLGEMQLAFVCLLMAQNFSGFNQWKHLVHLLCSCEDLVQEKPNMFIDFFDVLQYQLDECPEDFFRDILSENNFIASMLKTFARNIPPNSVDLRSRFERLKKFIATRFKWEIPESDSDEDDDEPVVVEME
ncbi:A1 cistron-splicing factor [Radiomyces spectabilis]|uniref:A1 cistron-splicing factor n=1 Tax=Radiomyces spectabilis TaxID=64574 RepID=UPI0022205396|nr:A1 cistron-splicing factor [Radiomyces spectabilis]KAI8372918.1 A1 cistron-splicing factor [Radiomyces spectabilis]